MLGSSEDIGWLQRTEGLPPVEDGTTRFVELLHDIRYLLSFRSKLKTKILKLFLQWVFYLQMTGKIWIANKPIVVSAVSLCFKKKKNREKFPLNMSKVTLDPGPIPITTNTITILHVLHIVSTGSNHMLCMIFLYISY